LTTWARSSGHYRSGLRERPEILEPGRAFYDTSHDDGLTDLEMVNGWVERSGIWLCLWLVEREGFQRAEHLGAAGSEQGRDLVAWRAGERWAFQCKRVQRFGPGDADAHWGRGVAHRELGNGKAALADFRRYLELRPDAENRDMFEEWIAELEAEISEP